LLNIRNCRFDTFQFFSYTLKPSLRLISVFYFLAQKFTFICQKFFFNLLGNKLHCLCQIRKQNRNSLKTLEQWALHLKEHLRNQNSKFNFSFHNKTFEVSWSLKSTYTVFGLIFIIMNLSLSFIALCSPSQKRETTNSYILFYIQTSWQDLC